MLDWLTRRFSSTGTAAERNNASNGQDRIHGTVKENLDQFCPQSTSKSLNHHPELYPRNARLKGSNVNQRLMIDDGLGMHKENTSNLTGYTQTSYYPQISNGFRGSYPDKHAQRRKSLHSVTDHNSLLLSLGEVQMLDWLTRRFSSTGTAAERNNASNGQDRIHGTVKENLDQFCPQSTSKSLNHHPELYPRNARLKGSNVNQRLMIDDGLGMHKENTSNLTGYTQTSYYPQISNGFRGSYPDKHAQRRKSLHSVTEHQSADSRLITGSHYSHPRKPTSVVGLPSVSIQPQTYLSDAQYSQEPATPFEYELNKSFTPMGTSTPREHATTTFGTDPPRKATADVFVSGESNVYGFQGRRQSSSEDQAFDSTGGNVHSSMSNSGNSSSAATTTTTDTVMPTIFNGSNKVAVAPQPQKRSSQQRNSAKEEAPKLRSPWQPTPTSSIPPSRSFHRRMSNEVFIDGPSPMGSITDSNTDARSYFEEKFRDLETTIMSSSTSRQNMSFNHPSQAQKNMMQDLVDKDMLIGRLQVRIQSLAGKLERQQIEFDDQRMSGQKETNEMRIKYSTLKKKYHEALDQLQSCKDAKEDALNEAAKQLFAAREQIRLRDLEIAALKKQRSHPDGGTNEHQNAELHDQIVMKNARIKQLEEMLEASQNILLNSSSHSAFKPELGTPRLRGVEILTEVETEEEDNV